MRIHYDRSCYNKIYIFKDRIDAGVKLASFVSKFNTDNREIVAIPAGGVPVASTMARELNLKLKVLLVSKILLPWTSEAGFGALSMFGDFELNRELIEYYKIDKKTVEEQIEKARRKIENRLKIIPKSCLIGDKGEKAYIVDDGLASGYTMLVALRSAKRFYKRVCVAVPTASYHAAKLVAKECDVFCINLRDQYPYAVADAYIEWHDVDDKEMLRYLDYCNSSKV